LGFGGTAKALARIVLSLGFAEILVWSPRISQERIDAEFGALPEALGTRVRPTSFEELLSNSDWVSTHLPLKPETRGILGMQALGLMKPGAALVNVSRGAVVEETALVEALRSGRLGGAGLDVFSAEPLPNYSVLRSLPNLVLTDHSAYASRESIAELRRRCVGNLIEELERKP
jgi:phosphoglycerate dehydrogenase-like enzyme